MAGSAGSKVRIQISVGDALLARIDDYCAQVGVSRSAFFSSTAGQYLEGYSSVKSTLEQAVAEMLPAMIAGGTFEED